LSDIGFSGCLVGWESLVRDAGVTTLNKISRLALDLPDREYPDKNQKLGAIIRSFAEAEAADHLDAESAFPALASVLSQVLHDDAFSLTKTLADLHGPSIMTMSRTTDAATRARINQALHIEYGGIKKRSPAPGDVFAFPLKSKRQRGGLPPLELEKFVPEQFFDSNKWKARTDEQRKTVLEGVRLILVEITPPCDHANLKKLVWHRYVLGVELNSEAAACLNKKADYLKHLPVFAESTGATLTISLNSRATASVPPGDIAAIGKRLYRLRTQLLSDIIRWVSGQQSRLGYLEL
jgi:hypothetical protein